MRKKRIGLQFGTENAFPWALINAIHALAAGAVEAAAVEISCLGLCGPASRRMSRSRRLPAVSFSV